MKHQRQFESAFAKRRVCVTGGAGFIGSHLCDALVRHGAQVVVLDDLSHGRVENLSEIRNRIDFVHGSILEPADVARAAADTQVIFHLAAIASVPHSVEDPELYQRINATGTVRVLEAARDAGTSRVIFSSSSSVYGDQPELPKIEQMVPDSLSPYAATKAAGEQMMRAYANCYPMGTISLRYFNIFGPRQRPDSPYAAVIPLFAEAMCNGTPPTVFGDGSQTRDFTHVDNAVLANLLAASTSRALEGQAVNVATGHGQPLLDLLKAMARKIGVEPTYRTAPPRVGEIMHSHASIEAARALLGYEPLRSFDDGLDETVDYYVGLFQPSKA